MVPPLVDTETLEADAKLDSSTEVEKTTDASATNFNSLGYPEIVNFGAKNFAIVSKFPFKRELIL